MKRWFVRQTLTSAAKYYSGTHDFRPALAMGVLGLIASAVLTQVGLAASPNATAAYFGGCGIAVSIVAVAWSVQGPILARYIDTDRMLADAGEESTVAE